MMKLALSPKNHLPWRALACLAAFLLFAATQSSAQELNWVGAANDIDVDGTTVDPGTFALQANTFLPIPEPGSGSLLGLTLGLLLLRRSRKKT